ncbi:SIS domain-containing protein [Collinsella sp. AGMB00827]|uniref:SIS domain-containing protein n=1 Tax=Collinsella ureilytica TaxID=2869515 RepID=A0ABS7MKH9_9ACTN|nr:SIS domain-containing protein [Collinsella urealyticum]MBY4797880.1 SIS domain-containing protein [Collinsella urealyticum]
MSGIKITEERRLTMWDYIVEAPGVALNNLGRSDELLEPLFWAMGSAAPARIWIVASGSSQHAALIALPFMRSCLPSVDVKVIPPSTFMYYDHEVEAEDIVFVVTQSGLSTNAIEALDFVHARGWQTICVTANPHADAREHAENVIDYGAGEELVGYVTKGVVTLAVFFMMLAAKLGGCSERLQEIEQVIRTSEDVRSQAVAFFESHMKDLTSMSVAYFMGAGPTWGVAAEGALKMGETVHIPSPLYELEEFIHGPNLQLTPAYTAFFFDAPDGASDRCCQIWRATAEVTDRAYLLTTRPELAAELGVLAVPELPSADLASLAFLPAIQTLSFLVSDALGSTKQHPLIRRFKAIAAAKTETFVNYDRDD